LLDACRQLEAAVPEQVAVIGVDNDEMICDLSEPRLSSVMPDAFRTGCVAAELLDALISRRRVARTGEQEGAAARSRRSRRAESPACRG
jgi:LacI family transcriptional regulator